MPSKIAQILAVVRGSMYLDGNGLAEYEIARAIRDANLRKGHTDRYYAMVLAARRTRLLVSYDDISGSIQVYNPITQKHANAANGGWE